MKQSIKIKVVHHNNHTNNNNRNNKNIYKYINIALKTNFENMNLGINLYIKSGDLAFFLKKVISYKIVTLYLFSIIWSSIFITFYNIK